MKQIYTLIFCLILGFHSNSQEIYDYASFKENALEAVTEGDYEDALAIFEKVHHLDPNYGEAMQWRAELLVELNKTKQLEELLDNWYKKGLFDQSPELYVTYGRYLMGQEQFKKSNEIYSAGVAKYPRYAHLVFNKGIMHYENKEVQLAVDHLKETISINPNNARAHYLLGIIALENGRLAEGFLALLSFLANSPTDDFSSRAIIQMNANLSQNYLEETDVVFSETGDDFAELNEILRNQIPLNKKYKLNCAVDDNYPRFAQAVFEYMGDHEIKDGYFESTFGKWIKAVEKKSLTEDFLYYSMASLDGKIGKIIKKKASNISNYSASYGSTTFWYDYAMRTKKHLGEIQEVITYVNDDGVPFIVGPLINEKKEGLFEYVDSYGRKTTVVNFENDLVNGVATYFDSDGEIIEEKEYKEGKKSGTHKYYDRGSLYYQGTWEDDKRTGELKTYYLLGSEKCIENYTDEKLDGKVSCLYENGEKKYDVFFEDDVVTGERIDYFETGEISDKTNNVDGKLEGKYISYSPMGDILVEKMFKNDEIVSDYKEIDWSGQLISDYVINGDIITSTTYNNGIKEIQYVIKNDKLDKIHYYDEGKENYSFLYKNGELKNVRQITDEKPKGEKLDIKNVSFYALDGTKLSYKEYKRGKLNGDSKFYYRNGQIKSDYTNEDGNHVGEAKEYDHFGNLTNRYYMLDGNTNGVSEVYTDGVLNSIFNYKDDQPHGPFKYFYKDGVLSYEGFYINGKQEGKAYSYSQEGKLIRISEYENDVLMSHLVYKKNGDLDYEINFKNLNGTIERTLDGKLETSTTTYVNGVRQGPYTLKEADGVIRSELFYQNDKVHGLAKYYNQTGVLTAEITRVLGKTHGPATYYSHLGNVTSKSNFNAGDEEGLETTFYQDGSISRTITNYADEFHGPMVYFNYAGDSIILLNYKDGLIEYFVEPDESGKLTKKTKISNKKYDITVKYPNGNTALNCSIKRNYLDGNFSLFNADGKAIIIKNFKDDRLEGEYVENYANGNPYKKQSFIKGNYVGKREFYSENGDILFRISYKDDVMHGPMEIYENGKLVKTKIYENGDLIEIK